MVGRSTHFTRPFLALARHSSGANQLNALNALFKAVISPLACPLRVSVRGVGLLISATISHCSHPNTISFYRLISPLPWIVFLKDSLEHGGVSN